MRRGRAVGAARARRGGVLPVLALALALAGCLFEPTPPSPAPPTATPTPRSTPTPTVQERVALPTPAPAPTPTATPVSELRGAGQLLYAGRYDGRDDDHYRYGVVAVNADGSDRRLLAEGPYNWVIASPDGGRFAAGGDGGDGASRVDLYAADGRLIRPFSFADPPWRGGASPAPWLTWSPDGQRAAVATGGRAGLGNITTWLLGADGAVEVDAGGVAWPGPWSPGGRLALIVGRRELWTVDATGRDARRLIAGNYEPVGWSADGATLYALGEAPDAPGDAARPFPGRMALVAIDAGTGAGRTLATVGDLAAHLQVPEPTRGFWIGPAALAPTGDRATLWLMSDTSGVSRVEASTPYLVVVAIAGAGAGRLVWRDRAPTATVPATVSWSPDGARLAYTYNGLGFGMRVAAVEAGDPAPVTIVASDITSFGGPFDFNPLGDDDPRWSPDGRWVAFNRRGEIAIAAGTAPARSWAIGKAGGVPTWRP